MTKAELIFLKNYLPYGTPVIFPPIPTRKSLAKNKTITRNKVPIIGMRKIMKLQRLRTKDAGITHRRCNLFQGEKRKMIDNSKNKSTCSTVTI
jgi:hypothetical protein